MPLMQDRGQTDRVAILANLNPDLWTWLTTLTFGVLVHVNAVHVKATIEGHSHRENFAVIGGQILPNWSMGPELRALSRY